MSRRLWVVNNSGSFSAIKEDGTGSFVAERHYAPGGDLEGITQVDESPNSVYVIVEQQEDIREYSVSDGTVIRTWDLTSTVGALGNDGTEGIAFVPNAWLAASGFTDKNGSAYTNSADGTNGLGGIMLVAVQAQTTANAGYVYAVDLKEDGTHTLVGKYKTSRNESCDLAFDASIGRLYILHNIDGNLIEVTDLTSSAYGADRKFTTLREIQVPSGSNIEGFGLTPALTGSNAVGDRWCFFTDDNAGDGALRWFRQLPSPVARYAGSGQSAPVSTPVPVPPSVVIRDAYSNGLPGVAVTFTVTSGGGAVTGASPTTSVSGVAAVASWTLGPSPGTNTVSAAAAGFAGSPVAFTAVGVSTGTVDTGAIAVRASGSGTNTFDALPGAGQWSTCSGPGGGGDSYMLASSVNTLAAVSISNTLVNGGSGNPPAANGLALWTSGGSQYVCTRPTGNRFTVLMASLVNASGTSQAALRIAYDLGISTTQESDQPGLRAFYSTTGAAGSWTAIPDLSSSTPVAGALEATVIFAQAWTNGAPLYVLWADDNANGVTDPAYTIDNVRFAPAAIPPLAIVTPVDGQVVSSNVTITVRVSGTASVTNVVFFADGSPLGSDATSPYALTWNGAPAGAHALTAVGWDAGGLATTSAVANVTVIEQQAQYVIVISVDGMGSEYVKPLLVPGVANEMTTFRRLQAEGAGTLNARDDADYAVTLPNHVTMMTSRGVLGADGHGWTSNGDPAPTDTIASNKGAYVAGGFDVAHDHGLRTGIWSGKSKFSLFPQSYGLVTGAADATGPDNGRDKIDYDLILTAEPADSMTADFTNQMTANPCHFTFVHYQDPDATGHSSGWSTDPASAFAATLKAVDTQIGNIVRMITNSPTLRGRTAIILTADHGGHGTTHGDTTNPLDYTIPFCVWGPGVAAGAELYTLNPTSRTSPGASSNPPYSGSQPIRNGDAANLALDLLGLGAVPGSTIDGTQDLRVNATRVLTVNTAHGTAVPAAGIHTNDWGTGIACQVSGIEQEGGTQYLCAGWALAGQADTNGATGGVTTAVTLTLTNDATLTWLWVTNYWLAVTSNGVPEWWLAQYGWTNNFDAASTNDVDGDGQPTWMEWVSDTDPTNSASVLRMGSLTADGDGMRIEWQGGTSVWQYLERSTSLGSDVWWTAIFSNGPVTTLGTNYQDRAATNTTFFYRIKTVR